MSLMSYKDFKLNMYHVTSYIFKKLESILKNIKLN